MNNKREIERQLNGVGERVRERVRHYADETTGGASELIKRGRRRLGRGSVDYGKQLSHAVEDMADEAYYQYRRARRQVRRHPLATTAVLAGTIGAFLLLRQLLRDHDED